MRIIPKKTKVNTEFFKGLSLGDVLVGFFGVLVMVFVIVSNLPGKLYLCIGLLMVFGTLLVRIDEDRNYVFILDMIRHFSYRRMYKKIPYDPSRNEEEEWELEEKERLAKLSPKQRKAEKKAQKAAAKLQAKEAKKEKPAAVPAMTKEERAVWAVRQREFYKLCKAEGRQLKSGKTSPEEKDGLLAKRKADNEAFLAEFQAVSPAKARKAATKLHTLLRKQEDAFLKSKSISDGVKHRLLTQRQEASAAAYVESKRRSNDRKRVDMKHLMPFTSIEHGLINYKGAYYGAVIEIPSVEFRFFSPYRQNTAIDRALGGVLRSISPKYSANLIKIDRPVMYDDYVATEQGKIEALRTAFVNGLLTEEELQNRVEIINNRIIYLQKLSYSNKVLLPFYYLALFDSDPKNLEGQAAKAMGQLRTGELSPKRLGNAELAVFLKYTNQVDFDEREIANVQPADYVYYAMPDTVDMRFRTVEVNSIITHNMRITAYPTTVSNAWGAGIFNIPGTKVVMKMKPIDRQKAIRAIDRSIDELRSQSESTGKSSKRIELSTHIDTLAELLVLLQNDNETLMEVNIYITAYDIIATDSSKLIVDRPQNSCIPAISGMKKAVRRFLSESSMRTTDMSFQQFEAFVGSQVSGYDPKAAMGRDIHSSTVAAAFPFVNAYLDDQGGVNLGRNQGVPVFINFFRRDSERVNSNMVIVGKSGSGKSFATKTLLSNLAAENSKIFVLDPENEYSELCHNLNGKMINVGNASHGRLNPFHIITNLEDDESPDMEEGDEAPATASSSFATHLQFLEEFFRQILPDIDTDAMEYLNNLINRVYAARNIDEHTDLSTLTAEDFPIFDDLYDKILEEFQATQSDYLRANLRVLMNYIAKFSTGGRNAALWNGPSTISTEENFIVFNFQLLLANRNGTVANAQMLLVLKWLDNEIIKNRDYNTKYGEQRKIVIVIDEAHVFIDTKYPLALDFMFQMAKRIRKYNGMQIVITQNIKDFVGSEEIARKSTAIINACQYSFIFSLAPNDMHDLCKLYEKAGEINEQEQEQIINAGRGQAFVVTSPTRRTSLEITTPPEIQRLFSDQQYVSPYFSTLEGMEHWEVFMEDLRRRRAERERLEELKRSATPTVSPAAPRRSAAIEIMEILAEDETPAAASIPEAEKIMRGGSPITVTEIPVSMVPPVEVASPTPSQDGPKFDMDSLMAEVKAYLRQEMERERATTVAATAAAVAALVPNVPASAPAPTVAVPPAPVFVAEPPAPVEEVPVVAEEVPARVEELPPVVEEVPAAVPPEDELPLWTASGEDGDDWRDAPAAVMPEEVPEQASEEPAEEDEEDFNLDLLGDFRAQLRQHAQKVIDSSAEQEARLRQEEEAQQARLAAEEKAARPAVWEVTLEELMAMPW